MDKNCNKWALAIIARQTLRFARSAWEENALHHIQAGKNKKIYFYQKFSSDIILLMLALF